MTIKDMFMRMAEDTKKWNSPMQKDKEPFSPATNVPIQSAGTMPKQQLDVLSYDIQGRMHQKNMLEKALAELAECRTQLDEYKRREEDTFTKLEGEKVAVLGTIPHQCPECLSDCYITILPDHLRVSIKHMKLEGCSRSMTEIIRPVAQFIEFV